MDTKHSSYYSPDRFSQSIKAAIDRLLAAIALIILAPVIAVVGIGIYMRMGTPVIFSQPRTGRAGQIITLYKFRTMTSEQSADGNLLPDEQRLTRLGTVLRRFSLDELPQLWNILKGDMSFVGPRPLLVEYLDLYTPEQARRLEVPPGLTGWAQINGRNAIGWEERFKLDVWYVDHWNLWLDLKILFLTIEKVIKQEGISQKGHVTVEKFKGTKIEKSEA
jgi:lipopolysaccharide/colanic/teichoic acid biosynthesis glycosyltransferase